VPIEIAGVQAEGFDREIGEFILLDTGSCGRHCGVVVVWEETQVSFAYPGHPELWRSAAFVEDAGTHVSNARHGAPGFVESARSCGGRVELWLCCVFGYWMVSVTVLTADGVKPGATAMNFRVSVAVMVMGPVYLVDDVVGVVPLVV